MARKYRKNDFLKGKKEKKVFKKPEPKIIKEKPVEIKAEVTVKPEPVKKTNPKPKNVKEFYEFKYKLLLIIPIILFIGALIQIGVQTSTTGSFVKKGISLSGGVSLTIYKNMEVDILSVEEAIQTVYPTNEINVRRLTKSGSTLGLIIEADIDGTDSTKVGDYINVIQKSLPVQISKDDYTVEVMGSSLGASFFKETFKALYVAFLFMGMVVFFYFGDKVKVKILTTVLTLIAAFTAFSPAASANIIAYLLGAVLIYLYVKNSIPSVAVIMAALSDIVITLAVFNLLGMKLTTAGIAGFLMLIGYSVDTDILLSTKVLKRKQGTIMDRIYDAMKTGVMMNLTTLVALSVALIFAESETIKQIMTILIIGLIADLVNTWIQNVGLLRLYLEKVKK